VVTAAGTYKVLSSIQADRTGTLTGTFHFWVAQNGTAVPNSATQVVLNQNLEQVMTVEWFLDASAGDTIAVEAYSTSSGQQLLAVAASSPVPAVPSIITTVLRIA
jgi:hypothetical protein